MKLLIAAALFGMLASFSLSSMPAAASLKPNRLLRSRSFSSFMTSKKKIMGWEV